MGFRIVRSPARNCHVVSDGKTFLMIERQEGRRPNEWVVINSEKNVIGSHKSKKLAFEALGVEE